MRVLREAETLRCSTCGISFPLDFSLCPHDGTPLSAQQAGDPLVGTVLAQAFIVERSFAHGGSSTLYEAKHTRTGRPYAIKVLHHDAHQRPETRRRFAVEAEALSRVQSPHVVEIIDLLHLPDGRSAMVMPLLRGEDLESLLRHGNRLSVDEALTIARDVLDGLQAAHERGIVHRDLKPSNVFLSGEISTRTKLDSPKRRAILIDFGVAKMDVESSTRTGVVVGTPAYMAPEQARSSRRADIRSDIYGVGALLYRMLTGRAPYVGENVNEILTSMMHKLPPRIASLRSDLSVEVESLADRAMARDPMLRFASADAMQNAIEEILRHRQSPGGKKSAEKNRPLADAEQRLPTTSRLHEKVLLEVGLSSLVLVWYLTQTTLRIAQPSSASETLAASFVFVVWGAAIFALAHGALKPGWKNRASLEAVHRNTQKAAHSALLLAGCTLLVASFVPAHTLFLQTVGLAAAAASFVYQTRWWQTRWWQRSSS